MSDCRKVQNSCKASKMLSSPKSHKNCSTLRKVKPPHAKLAQFLAHSLNGGYTANMIIICLLAKWDLFNVCYLKKIMVLFVYQ